MYYLTFFIDYQPFFRDKVTSWLSRRKSYGCYIKNEAQKYDSVAKQYLLSCPAENLHHYYQEPWYSRYEKCWYICDLHEQYSSLELPELLIEPTNFFFTLDKIDFLLAWFADNYQWSIIPWQKIIPFRSFVFVSREKILRDKFIECCDNVINIPFINNRKSKMLVSTHEVSDRFSKVVQAIVFEENINTIGKIWDICQCDRKLPLAMKNLVIYW